MSGRCDFYSGATVQCGTCGNRQDFAATLGGSGEHMARKAGWQIEWRPKPYVRCPSCRGLTHEPPPQSGGE